MRIDDLNRPAQTPAPEPTDQVGERAKNESASRRASDQVDISQLAHSLSNADTARQEKLRLEVQSGTYRVQPDAVAHALIDEHLKS